MTTRYSVTIASYGGMSWRHGLLTRQLAARGIPILNIRSSPYPEMARAEQVRQALASDVETLVFVDSHIDTTVHDIERLVAESVASGCIALPSHVWMEQALEFAAVPRAVLEAVVAEETRRYSNSAVVSTTWAGKKVPAVPVASPWNRDGSSLRPGEYLTDSEAFLERAGSLLCPVDLPTTSTNRQLIQYSSVNSTAPLTEEPGSRFALCIPSCGPLDYDQSTAVYQLEKVGMTVFRIHDCPWIDQARSYLAERATELGKGVFFLDHDIQFTPNDVLRLCEQVLERNAVVAAAYCMRKSGANLIGSFDLPPGPLEFFKNGSIEPAYYCGLGFAATPYDILDRMALPPLWSRPLQRTIRPWFALDCSTGFYAGEDVSFCNRVHDLTVSQEAHDEWKMTHSGRQPRIFIDTRVRIAHRGVYDYGVEDAGLVVPRVEALRTIMTTSKAEARARLVKVLDLPVETQLEQLPFEDANPAYPQSEIL